MSKKLSTVQILFTVFSLIIVNYLTINKIDTTQVLIVFVLLQVLLYKMNPLCAFVFCFVMNANTMNNFTFLWSKLLTILFSFSIFIFNPKYLGVILRNNKLKNVFLCSLIFSFYVIIVNIMTKTNVDYKVIFNNFNIIFGFLIILPAYYFAIRQPKDFFILLSSVSGTFLVVYYVNLIFNFNLFEIGDINSSIESDLTRLAGYDIRQFIIFYFFLIPAFLLTKAVPSIYKYCIIGIGILAFLVLVLGIYRLAMFYNFMGLLLSIYFIGKYVKTEQLFKRFIYIAIFIGFALYFFSEYILQFQKVYEGTFDYFSGKGEDKSADERFLNQTPILLAYIYSNFWTGCGVVEASLMTKKEMFGFVDIPIVGSLAKFGFIGIFIYYIRFYLILKDKMKLTRSYFSSINEHDKLLLYILLTVRAYIISLITFRLFYISWELAFDWQQSEFGLLVGIFLALEHLTLQKKAYVQRILSE